ncbi:WD40 repeat domain-containing serine/threonine-protein kinase [Spongiactinospora sp. TRM90649]|uniref:WD40 repeat domain-containing serine/threonine protein kinase n=1 Tax=Spongiactinospora sp. TRM90649 TaxID=3031114 RepID=UPI0023F8EA14|nr:WD40 repeat domain-containing serine/threonine-protein kinase [Spongiactinospora sp. TRM90649]MDF5755643.1 WD40 repeat domain-containing serine/threonine-protein kinase [Spongiactinospora sp. TRM90649]
MTSRALSPGDPERIGGYLLAGRLGEGGQGVVFDAYDPAGRRVAIKLLHAEADRARMARELSALSRVAPFCTASVLASDMEATRPYIVSEFIDGPSLRDAINEGGPLDAGGTHRLAIAMATALTVIHAAGVVHRDLKPDNVLLGPDGPRLIDFGIARTDETRLTATGMVTGTPTYMAPEIITGDRAEPSADVFAWGAIMLYAATGVEPFHADNLGAVMHRVLAVRPDVSPLPESLRPLVTAALSKKPGERPTASGLLLALLGDSDPAEGAKVAEDLRGDASPTLGLLAEGVYSRLPPAGQEVVPEILLRLVSVEDGRLGTRPAARAELGESEAVAQVLREFVSAGLIREERRRERSVVQLSRPGLLMAWTRLREWANGERDGLPVQRRVTEAATLWESGGRKDSDLPQGSVLEEAMAWAATGRRHVTLTPLEADFLNAATVLTRRRARNRRLIAATLAVLLVVALGATVLAEQRRVTVTRQSERLAVQLNEAVARRLAAQAAAMRQGDPASAMRLSVAAYRIAPVREAVGALHDSLTQRETSVITPPAWNFHYTLSVDGTLLVGAGPDAITLHDPVTGRLVRRVAAPGLEASGIAFGATKDHALVDTPRGQRLWDLRTGRERPGNFGEERTKAAFGADGTTMMTFKGDEFLVWDVRDGRELLSVPADEAWDRALGGGRYFATASSSPEGRLRLYDLRTRERMRVPVIAGEMGMINRVALSADGETMAMQSDTGIVLAETVTGKRLKTLPAYGGDAYLWFAPDGRALIVQRDTAVDVIRVSDGVRMLSYRLKAGEIQEQTIRLTPDARSLRLIGPSGAVMTFDVSGELTARQVPKRKALDHVSYPDGASGALSPDGRWAAVGTGPSLRPSGELWDAARGVRRIRMAMPAGETFGNWFATPVFTPDGRTLAVAQGDSPRVHLWDVERGTKLGEITWKGYAATALALTPDGARLAVAASTFTGTDDLHWVQVWRIPSRTPTGPRVPMTAKVLALAYAPSGGVLAGGDTASVLIPPGGGKARGVPKSGEVRALAYAPDGRTLVLGDAAGGVQFFDPATLRPRGPVVPAHPGRTSLLAYAPGGGLLISSGGGDIGLWDTAGGVVRLDGLPAGEGALKDREVLAVAFLDKGAALRVLRADGTITDRPLAPPRVAAEVCRRATAGLTPAEWARYVPEIPYRATCP